MQKVIKKIKIAVLSSDIWLVYAAIFSTPTDCMSENFVWNGPEGDIVIYVSTALT